MSNGNHVCLPFDMRAPCSTSNKVESRREIIIKRHSIISLDSLWNFCFALRRGQGFIEEWKQIEIRMKIFLSLLLSFHLVVHIQ